MAIELFELARLDDKDSLPFDLSLVERILHQLVDGVTSSGTQKASVYMVKQGFVDLLERGMIKEAEQRTFLLLKLLTISPSTVRTWFSVTLDRPLAKKLEE